MSTADNFEEEVFHDAREEISPAETSEVSIEGISTSHEVEMCPICLEKVEDDVRTLECKHTFHGKCIKALIKAHCPCCRHPIAGMKDKNYDNEVVEFSLEDINHLATPMGDEFERLYLEEDMTVLPHQMLAYINGSSEYLPNEQQQYEDVPPDCYSSYGETDIYEDEPSHDDGLYSRTLRDTRFAAVF